MVNLTREECVYALGTHDLGRLCRVVDGFPLAFPVNYRMVVEPAADPPTASAVHNHDIHNHDIQNHDIQNHDIQNHDIQNHENHRLGQPQLVIVFRARHGGVLDHPGEPVGFEIDGIDPVSQTGWSVLARGTLHEGHSQQAPTWLHSWDPHPWTEERDTWLYLAVDVLSGRQLVKGATEWAFEIRGYL